MSNKNEVKKLNDFFIRYFFGLEGDEDLLLSFINAIMIDSNFATFKSVEIINPFNLSEKAGNKESIVDLKAITEDGIIVIIEIQTYSTKNFFERTLYYWSKNYSNVLRGEDGYISMARIYSFIEAIAKFHRMGKEILIVTSGAVGLGAKKINAVDLGENSLKQACAAIGQSQPMSTYEDGFSKYDIITAQILLTEEDFSNRRRYLNLRSTFDTLLKYKVIPIINENDTVSSDEVEFLGNITQVSFSENDKLSALVASELDADLLIILSDINGLYDDNPKTNQNAKFIHEVFEITKEIENLGLEPSKGGRGGIKTKLQAAKIVTRSGCALFIANGKKPDVLKDIFETKDKTIFYPVKEIDELNTKKRWIAYATTIIGKVIVNSGAKKAIMEKESSLLPIGVMKIVNEFKKGDIVSIADENGEEFARGIINYNSEDAKKITGHHSDDILKLLGYKNYDALITRDYIVIL